MTENKTEQMLKVAPSKEAAIRFLNKEPDAWKDVLYSLGERTLLIAAGIGILGDRKNLVRNSIAGSIAIEVYLLWYYNEQLKEQKQKNP